MKNRLFQPILKITTIFAAFFSIANAAGVLDRTFGTNGKSSIEIGSQLSSRAMVIQPDGKIIVAGTVFRTVTQTDIAIVRFNPNGMPDSSFGEGGKSIVSISLLDDKITAIALAPDGKIIVAGSIITVAPTSSTDFLVVRFTQSGNLDTTFGNNGAATVNQGSYDNFYAVAVQPDRKIVATGNTSDGDRAAVIRFNANGSLDGTFANGGVFYMNLSPTSGSETFFAVSLLPNGRILLGGTAWDNLGVDILTQLEVNGTLAQNFGNNGVKLEFSPSNAFSDFDLAILPDGKFLAVSRSGIRRYLSNGEIDQSFRNFYTHGGLEIPFAGNRIAVRSDGRFIILNQGDGSPDYAVAYNNDGRSIHRFRISYSTDVAVQSDNKFIIADLNDNTFEVTRYVSINSPATRIVDFDYDERSDIAVARAGLNLYVLRSFQNVISYTMIRNSGEGVRPIPEDFYSSDPSRFPLFYWRYSSQNNPAYFDSITENGNYTSFQWGISSDIPVGGDYDGETLRNVLPFRKSTELAVFRPSSGTWWIYNRLTNTASTIQWGTNGDKPVPADYDYDGITEIAVYRPSTGTWWIRRSSDGGNSAIQFGIASDIPLTGDFDGDGKADLTVYRASEGNWYQLLTTEGFRVVHFGISTDSPVPGDYDGDGRHDVAVFRDGLWYILQSTEGLKIVQWGVAGDSPVAVRYDQ